MRLIAALAVSASARLPASAASVSQAASAPAHLVESQPKQVVGGKLGAPNPGRSPNRPSGRRNRANSLRPIGEELNCRVPTQQNPRDILNTVALRLWQWTQVQSSLRQTALTKAPTVKVNVSGQTGARSIELGLFDVLRASARRVANPAVFPDSVFKPIPVTELREMLSQTKRYPDWSCLEHALLRPEVHDTVFGGHTLAKNEGHQSGPVAVAQVVSHTQISGRPKNRMEVVDVLIGIGAPNSPKLFRVRVAGNQSSVLELQPRANPNRGPAAQPNRQNLQNAFDGMQWVPTPYGEHSTVLQIRDTLIAQVDSAKMG